MTIFATRDLAEFGLPLLPSTSTKFSKALTGVKEDGGLLPPESVHEFSALLENVTEQPILGLVQLWKSKNHEGRKGRATLTPLASSLGIEALLASERFDPGNRDIILPRSRRLLTPNGVRGDNSDVARIPTLNAALSCCISFGSWLEEDLTEITSLELQLDTVFLGDGQVLGPDESGTLEQLRAGLRFCREEAFRLRSEIEQGVSLPLVNTNLGRISPGNGGLLSGRDLVVSYFRQKAIYFLQSGDSKRLLLWVDWFVAGGHKFLSR